MDHAFYKPRFKDSYKLIEAYKLPDTAVQMEKDIYYYYYCNIYIGMKCRKDDSSSSGIPL